MKHPSLLALAVASLLCIPPAGAKTRAMRFERLSAAQGLSQSSVMCLLQDSQGFLWLGTEDGLNRYDGYAFTVYRHDPNQAESLPADFVWGLAEDANGDLWVATEGGGLARWERSRDRFVRYPVEEKGLPNRQLRLVRVDSKGFVWVGTKGAGLARLDPRSQAWTHFRHDPNDPRSLSDNDTYALLEDRNGRVWVGTNGGIDRLEGDGGFTHYRHDPKAAESLADDRVRALVEDRDGGIWVGTFGGGLDLVKADGRFEHHRHSPTDSRSLADNHVHALLQDKAGRLWVGTRSGLHLWGGDGGFALYRHNPLKPESLGDDGVLSLLEDRTGLLWVGTRAGGVCRWNPATWAFGHVTADPSDPQSLRNPYVTSFAEDASGRLWVGTMGGGLHEMDRESGRLRHFGRGDAGLSDDRVMALLHDRKGSLWVGTMDGGLHRLDRDGARFTVSRSDPSRPGGLSSNAVVALHEDRRGALWVGTYRGGLNRVDPVTGSVSVLRHDPADPTSLGSDIVTTLAEDPSGALWVGTEGGGLSRLGPEGRPLARLRHDPDNPGSLADDTVYALHVDAQERLWVGTRNGLSRLDAFDAGTGRATFHTFTAASGLANEVVYGIEPDASGRLWLSTNAGLARFDPRTELFRSYHAGHGLQGEEFNFGAHYRSRRGELFFGGPGGFNAFLPETLQASTVRPPLVLTSFLKFNRPAPDVGPAYALRGLELGHRDAVVSFEFAALDYAAPERNRYAYRLEGFDAEWIDMGRERRLTFTNLDAGRYVLRVRAANSDGLWSEEAFALPISVVPPPWRSPWAYAAYVLAVGGALLQVVLVQRRKARREAEYRRRLELEVKQRTEELGERNEQLERLNSQLVETSLTDSLTGLRNRRYLFEHIEKELRFVQRQHHEVKAGLHREAQQLVFMMVDLDWFKPINDTCGHAAGDRVLQQVRQILEKVCRSSDVLIRWGGDEFLVVGRSSDLHEVHIVAERVREAIERTPFDLENGQVAHLTCSIGFTAYPSGHGELSRLSLEQVVALADQALYSAKKTGRNTWVGLLGTPDTDVQEVLAALQDDPAQVLRSGQLAVLSSGLYPDAVSAVQSKEA
jgi:diguanylate cyclase (GGDEF)-like protein